MLRWSLLKNMPEKIITKKDVEYVAKLARISITEEEKSNFQGQLENILDYIGKLQAAKTDGVPPAAHPHAVSNVMRKDEAKPFQNIPAVLNNAPEKEETYFKVKKVIE